MKKPDKKLRKLLNGTIKMRELEALLGRFGYECNAGKGSHRKWTRPGCQPIILAGHDKEVKPYMIKYVISKLTEAGWIVGE